MVNKKEDHINNSLQNCDFFATYVIMKYLGMNSISRNLFDLTENLNETKNIK